MCVFIFNSIVFIIGDCRLNRDCGIRVFGRHTLARNIQRCVKLAMFAFLALAGDVGCAGGPTFAGKVAGMLGDNLKMGILAATVFPITLIITLIIMNLHKKSLYNTKYL